jgi:hypothetical protein
VNFIVRLEETSSLLGYVFLIGTEEENSVSLLHHKAKDLPYK